MNKMTKQEALEFFQGVELKFVFFFKYCFYYEGEKDGIPINVVFGGDSNDIYRTEYEAIEIFNKDEDFEHFQVLKSDKKQDRLLYQFSEI